jgi:hypothetical protein
MLTKKLKSDFFVYKEKGITFWIGVLGEGKCMLYTCTALYEVTKHDIINILFLTDQYSGADRTPKMNRPMLELDI